MIMTLIIVFLSHLSGIGVLHALMWEPKISGHNLLDCLISSMNEKSHLYVLMDSLLFKNFKSSLIS